MKKNVKIRVLSLIAASLLLCGALTVAAVMGSPYETLKKAVLDALTYRNVTMEARVALSVDGGIYEEHKSFFIAGDDNYLEYTFDKNGDPDGYRYYSKNLNIYRDYTGADGTQWYRASVSGDPYYNDYNRFYRNNSFAMFSPEEREGTQMRFMELLADALVGDLKNNITMSQNGGNRLIQGTLTEAQIPELVKAGIDVLIEQAGNWRYDWRETVADGKYTWEHTTIKSGVKTVTAETQDARTMNALEREAWENNTYYDVYGNEGYGIAYVDGFWYVLLSPREFAYSYTAQAAREDFGGNGKNDDPFDIPIQNLVINYVRGEAEVDAQGEMLSLEAEAKITITNIFGDTSTVGFEGSLHFTDIGTSEAQCPIPGASQLLTPEYMETHFGRVYGDVYFTLNADGSIDADSVTTTYPGENERKYQDQD